MPTMQRYRPAGRESVLDSLMDELNSRTKAVSSTAVGPYMHGPDGLWSYPGMERPVISTRIKPKGLGGMLPARGTNTMNPIYPYLTGFTDPAETPAEGPCDDPPTAGQMKTCTQTAVFGRYAYQTPVLDIRKLGQIINRSEFTDYSLVNDPLSNTGGITTPATMPGSLSLVNDAATRFAAVGLKFQNKLLKQTYEGNPANNTNGGYAEFPGLDIQIRTGIRDAITGTLCPSLDSMIYNANYKKVSDSSGNDNLVNVLTYMIRTLKNTADRSGLTPVEWAIVMREPLFYEITAIWPCNYLTYRCINMNGGLSVADPSDAIAMRDEMRQNNYLVIDGAKVNVILDDAIPEETSGDTNRVTATCFASDIYIVPLSAGGQATLFWEYFDYSGPNAAMQMIANGSLPQLGNYFWSDGGQYIWHTKPPTNFCVQWLGSIDPRLILRTPHLAARLNNVQYCPLIHPRDAFSDDPYYVNGGVTSQNTAPSLYPSYTS